MVNHPTELVGSDLLGAGSAPRFLTRTDQEFLPAVLEELKSQAGRDALPAQRTDDRNAAQTLRLHQPVHRMHHLIMLEARCRTPGFPRLDPERIQSAGLVIRRLSGAGANAVQEGWMDAAHDLRGWVALTGAAVDQDPEPERRKLLGSGHVELDRRIALLRGIARPLTERSSPLFVAPPQVCESAGRTLLYGLVPVASAEHAGGAADVPALSRDTARGHLPGLLRNGNSTSVPRAGQTLSGEDGGDAALEKFINDLRQLAIEFDAFGDSEDGQDLLDALNRLSVTDDPGSRPLGSFLRAAADVFVYGVADATVRMPRAFPAISVSQEIAFADRVRSLLQRRLATFTAADARFANRRGESGEIVPRFVARAFIRVRREDGCPPDLVWSEPSELFEIVPWFESGKQPPVKIALPDATDRGFLEKLKPNVAFELPESLFNMLRSPDLESLMNGTKPSDGPKLGLGWICGFSIPLITLCAFIVLSIFLSLLNFIFFWLPFIKICIPFPKIQGGDGGGS